MLKRIGLLILSLLLMTGCTTPTKEQSFNIVVTNFPCYDFVRAITKNDPDISIKMLIKPGMDSHSYEPTPQDMVAIKESDLFFYVGGESDDWVGSLLADMNPKRIVKMLDLVSNLKLEEHVEGMEEEKHEEHDEHEEEYDEHVWTSPKNTMEIVEGLNKRMCALDKNHASKFNKNTENYIEQIASVDYSFKQVVKNAKRKDIVVGDRFPLLYFAKEYGLTYSAAFPGCSEQTEPSAATISYLIDKVKKDHNPAIFKIELSNGQIARTISEETGKKVLTIQSMHNVSAEDFNNGETYVSIMRKNVKAVKEALQ